MTINFFKSLSKSRTSPPERHAAITPDDANDLAEVPKALYIGVAGNIAVVDKDGTEVIYPVANSQILPFVGVRIKATGTTATGIIAWYE